MGIKSKKLTILGSLVLAILTLNSCQKTSEVSIKPFPEPELGYTIDSLCEIFAAESFMVSGYGLVMGLAGTGSAECPPEIKQYMTQYILKQMPSDATINPEKLIAGTDTAVVGIYGIIPAATSKNQRFDVKVFALPQTQTTSLAGGRLYSADLKITGRSGLTSKVIAKAQGPVFIDKVSAIRGSEKEGFVLNGGIVFDEYKLTLALKNPNYQVANTIRNRINGRFGNDIAQAISKSVISLSFPEKYKDNKNKFVAMIRTMYITVTEELTQKRVSQLAWELAGTENKVRAEITLEAIGKSALTQLGTLLDSADEETRMRAARCMLSIGDKKGLGVLREIAFDKHSDYRIMAINAVATSAKRTEAGNFLRRLMEDDDFKIRFIAYEYLSKFDDISISRKRIGGDFDLEILPAAKPNTVFVSRSGRPRVVLLGSHIVLDKNVFIQSDDGSIIVSSPAGQDYVSVIRQHPKLARDVWQLKSSFSLSNVIEALGQEPTKVKGRRRKIGVAVSYSEVISLLQKMAEKGAINAQFKAGPMAEVRISQ